MNSYLNLILDLMVTVCVMALLFLLWAILYAAIPATIDLCACEWQRFCAWRNGLARHGHLVRYRILWKRNSEGLRYYTAQRKSGWGWSDIGSAFEGYSWPSYDAAQDACLRDARRFAPPKTDLVTPFNVNLNS